MGAITDKINYLSGTKSQLKDMINYGLDEDNKITSSTTFRNYVSSIFNAFLESLNNPSTLFTNLPKITGSGSNITLNGTANAPMRIMLNASELSQSGTPTPSSPQAVHTISGSNTIKVESKNQLTGTWEQGTFSYVDNTNYTDANRIRTTKFAIQPSTEYTFSCNLPLGEIAWIFYQENGTTYIAGSSLNTTGTTATITTPNNAYYIRIRIGNGTYPKIYTTDYHQRLDDDSYISQEAEVDLSSKNLAFTNWAVDFVDRINNTGKAKLTTFDNKYCLWWAANAGYNDYDNLYIFKTNWKANTQYTISFDVFATASTGSINMGIEYTDGTISNLFATYNAWEHKVITSTANKTIKYIRGYYSTGNAYIDLNTFMINEGTQELPYEPYFDYGFYGKIGNYEDKFIRTSGKNLFDENKTKDNFFYNSSGTTTTDSTNKFINIEIPLKSSYTISWGNKINGGGIVSYVRLCEYNGNTFIKRTSIQDNNTTITLDSNTTKVIASVDAGPNAYFVDLMINEGSTALDYEPYGSNEWYIKKNIGKVVLDGTNVSTYVGTLNTQYGHQVAQISKSTLGWQTSWTTNIMLLNKYHEIASTSNVDNGTFATNFAQAYLYIFDDNFTDLTTARTELVGTIIYFPLATPTYTQITGTLETQLENIYQKLLSYTGTTNISQVNNDLSFNLSVSAIEE